jgi:pyridoxine 5-phosphate synthase
MLKLGVNIDHVATLRQARYARMPGATFAEPSVLEAAAACERAGAHGITVHLRADRRHIQDADVHALRKSIRTRLNLELGNTEEIVSIALQVRPDEVCLVPESREEITTEGGLDVGKHEAELLKTVRRFHVAGVRVSMFIDPEPVQVDASARIGADMVELHTGAFANATEEDADRELDRLKTAAILAAKSGLQVNAGHGINYVNIARILEIPNLSDLNIGHSIVSRAVMCGLENAVRLMLEKMAPYSPEH